MQPVFESALDIKRAIRSIHQSKREFPEAVKLTTCAIDGDDQARVVLHGRDSVDHLKFDLSDPTQYLLYRSLRHAVEQLAELACLDSNLWPTLDQIHRAARYTLDRVREFLPYKDEFIAFLLTTTGSSLFWVLPAGYNQSIDVAVIQEEKRNDIDPRDLRKVSGSEFVSYLQANYNPVFNELGLRFENGDRVDDVYVELNGFAPAFVKAKDICAFLDKNGINLKLARSLGFVHRYHSLPVDSLLNVSDYPSRTTYDHNNIGGRYGYTGVVVIIIGADNNVVDIEFFIHSPVQQIRRNGHYFEQKRKSKSIVKMGELPPSDDGATEEVDYDAPLTEDEIKGVMDRYRQPSRGFGPHSDYDYEYGF